MKTTAVRDIVVPISSSIRKAHIDFSAMTASIVVELVRDGGPVEVKSGLYAVLKPLTKLGGPPI